MQGRQQRVRIRQSWWAGVALVAALGMGGAQADGLSCGPSQIGAPCSSTGGVATLPDAGAGPGLGVGNPVHLATGNKYQRDTDLPPMPGVLGLELVRHYNAGDPRTTALGRSWTLSYDARLYRVGSSLQIVQPDGSRLLFARNPDDPAVCDAVDPQSGVLHVVPAGADAGREGERYLWQWRDGRILAFDTQGRLVGITAPTGARVLIERGLLPGQAAYGEIVQVTDPAGRQLRMQYGQGPGWRGVTRIDTPAGTFVYAHGPGGRLESVRAPGGSERRYLHEPEHQAGQTHLLTGIVSVSQGGEPVRLTTWAYDAEGRAVLSSSSVPGPGQGDVRMAYGVPPAAGKPTVTRVTDAQGQVTQVEIGVTGGRYGLRSVTGPGCPGCAAPGVYHAGAGGGQGVSAEPAITRDASGRIIQLGEGAQQVTVSWWRDSLFPERVLLPSQVPGKVRELTIDWQTHKDAATGLTQVLPVALTDRGWEPGTERSGPMRMSRTVSLTWAREGGVATLTKVSADPVVGLPMPDPAQAPGWTGLQITRNDFGAATEWQAHETGREQRSYDGAGRLTKRVFADGGQWEYHYNGRGQVKGIVARAPDGVRHEHVPQDLSGMFVWEDDRLIKVTYPEESESRVHDDQGRVTKRTVSRYGLFYSESYQYDDAGRLQVHALPEGGRLHYAYTATGGVATITWEDPAGRSHPLITPAPSGAPGYRHVNGLETRAALQQGQLAVLAVHQGTTPVMAQSLRYDTAGRLVGETTRQGDRAVASGYGYDAKGRLAVTTRDTRVDHYGWLPSGASLAVQQEGRDYDAAIVRGPSGLPTQVGGRTLHYGPGRRLSAVTEAGVTVARYWHNAWGERIASQTAAGTVQYLYHHGKVVAEWQCHAECGGVGRRFVYAGHVPVAMIVYEKPRPAKREAAGAIAQQWDRLVARVGTEWQVYAIHADAVGLPRLLTDAQGTPRWGADYTAFGEVIHEWGAPRVPLRLPGQWYDETTGWYDNYQRTYDPRHGHYLEPDPLGPLPGSTPFGYAAQQPRRYADPLGLILFAFDGTWLDAPDWTNVRWMSALYGDTTQAGGQTGSTPAVHYRGWPRPEGGPGVADGMLGLSAQAIVSDQWSALLASLADYQRLGGVAPIDLVGYSRGAALARHFGNALVSNMQNGRFFTRDTPTGAVLTACVDLRFMGLFDTVAQFGVLGWEDTKYNFSISSRWGRVAHAVALHEHRRFFPLTLAGQGDNVIEAAFLGAHGDIGGGLGGDLSDVALQWMMRQAAQAGVPMQELSPGQKEVSDPLLHDQRSPYGRLGGWWRSSPDRETKIWEAEDRAVYGADSRTLQDLQANDPDIGRSLRFETERFIERVSSWNYGDIPVVGTVDMRAYAQWLDRKYGLVLQRPVGGPR